MLDGRYLAAFLAVSVAFGAVLSVSALALEKQTFRRHLRQRDSARLLLYAVLDNAGYRQLSDVFRAQAFVDLARRTRGWGEQRRRGIGVDVGPTALTRHGR
jgi:hypothetical protein